MPNFSSTRLTNRNSPIESRRPLVRSGVSSRKLADLASGNSSSRNWRICGLISSMVPFLPYGVLVVPRSSQQSCREFRVLLDGLVKAFKNYLMAALIGMNVNSVLDLEGGHIL